jgi:hypothetical protein
MPHGEAFGRIFAVARPSAQARLNPLCATANCRANVAQGLPRTMSERKLTSPGMNDPRLESLTYEFVTLEGFL